MTLRYGAIFWVNHCQFYSIEEGPLLLGGHIENKGKTISLKQLENIYNTAWILIERGWYV